MVAALALGVTLAGGAAAPAQSPAPAASEAAHADAGADVRALAMRAFGHFRDGLATGAWEPWFDLLAEDVVIVFPMGKFKGRHEGKATAIEFFRYVRSVYPEGLAATLEFVTVDGNRAVFEFRSEGTLVLGGERRPYKNRVAVAMEFRDGRVVAYREYFGSDGS